MTKERYTLTLESYLDITAGFIGVITEPFDLTKLIPVRYRGRKFMLYSSFNTTAKSVIVDMITDLQVSIKLPQTYNARTSYTDLNGNTNLREGLLIGIAQPIMCYEENGGQYSLLQKYAYSEDQCMPVMIDYPEVSTVDCVVYPAEPEELQECFATLKLVFELMD